MVYEPGQVRRLFKHITPDVNTFLLGGPADGDEAQILHAQYPGVEIVGFEPCRKFFAHQQEVGFPGRLFPQALSDTIGTADFYLVGEDDRSSRLVSGGAPAYTVETTTIDAAVHELGLRSSIVCWLDIERAEPQALRGAAETLASGKITIVYLEAFDEMLAALTAQLEPYGLHDTEHVNVRHGVSDIIFTKRT
jgi:FkbM family methyltransferase